MLRAQSLAHQLTPAPLTAPQPAQGLGNLAQALLATQEDAAYNRLADARLIVGAQDVVADVAPFDVVVANILANPLIELAGEITGMLVPGGKLVLSGILHAQIAQVQAAYPNMDFELPALEADAQGAQWVRLVATKAGAQYGST